MELIISKEEPEWNKVPEHKHKKMVIVRFPNCSFKWMPTYKQLEQIKQALDNIEKETWS